MGDNGLVVSGMILGSTGLVLISFAQIFRDMCMMGLTLSVVGAVLFLVGLFSGPEFGEPPPGVPVPSSPNPPSESPRKP